MFASFVRNKLFFILPLESRKPFEYELFNIGSVSGARTSATKNDCFGLCTSRNKSVYASGVFCICLVESIRFY